MCKREKRRKKVFLFFFFGVWIDNESGNDTSSLPPASLNPNSLIELINSSSPPVTFPLLIGCVSLSQQTRYCLRMIELKQFLYSQFMVGRNLGPPYQIDFFFGGVKLQNWRYVYLHVWLLRWKPNLIHKEKTPNEVLKLILFHFSIIRWSTFSLSFRFRCEIHINKICCRD